VAKLGYKQCIVPKSAEKSLGSQVFEGMEVLGCRNLKEVINNVFRSHWNEAGYQSVYVRYEKVRHEKYWNNITTMA
jgi:hypothetical protein